MTESKQKPTILTAGHSTRKIDAFCALLQRQGVEVAVDIRSHPFSKRHPWFSRHPLAAHLALSKIDYVWLKWLGGHRRSSAAERAASPHTALPEGGFRSYADAMETVPFREALSELMALAEQRRTLIFCAEKDPMRCHRRYLSDLLTVLGFRILHVTDREHVEEHILHPDLVVHDGRLVYSGKQRRLEF
jgi:uncharacterized protein (DUF488 family)